MAYTHEEKLSAATRARERQGFTWEQSAELADREQTIQEAEDWLCVLEALYPQEAKAIKDTRLRLMLILTPL